MFFWCLLSVSGLLIVCNWNLCLILSVKIMNEVNNNGYGYPKIELVDFYLVLTQIHWVLFLIFQVEENICKFAKKGLTPSQIGVILRDSHGIAQVGSVTGSKILRILKAHGACFIDAILHTVQLPYWKLNVKFVTLFSIGRPCSWNSWGSVPPHQESSLYPQAFGEE